MLKEILAQNEEIVVGVDVHTDSQVIAVKKDKEIIDRYSMTGDREQWKKYLERFPGCVLHVVYEAGPQGYNLLDLLGQLNGHSKCTIHVYIAPPSMLPQAPGKNKVKTDRRDAVKLILAFETGCFRPVIPPTPRQRVHRQLVRERARLKKDCARLKNRLHGMIKFHGLSYPQQEDRWSKHWFKNLLVQAKQIDDTGNLHFVLNTEIKLLQTIRRLQQDTDKQIKKMFRKNSPEKDLLDKLTRQCGVGVVTASVIATETPDFFAFDNSSAYASYTGLVSGTRSSGRTTHLGPITKVGNKRLRWAFVESAWTWVRCDQQAKLKFEQLKARRGAKKAIVAMARRLAVRIYHQIVNNAPPTPTACHDRP